MFLLIGFSIEFLNHYLSKETMCNRFHLILTQLQPRWIIGRAEFFPMVSKNIEVKKLIIFRSIRFPIYSFNINSNNSASFLID